MNQGRIGSSRRLFSDAARVHSHWPLLGAALVNRLVRSVLGSFADYLLGGQESIHRSGAEALEVQRNELEAQRLEDTGKLLRHGRIQSSCQFVASDLDA